MSTALLLSVGALALLDTLSPTTLGVTVYMLLSERGKIAGRLLVYLSTVACFYFIVGVVLMLGLDTVTDVISGLGNNALMSRFMTILGLGLLIGSFFIPAKNSTPKVRKPKSKSISAMVALGLTTGLIEVGTALPYFAAVGIMTAARLHPVEWLPILAGYNVIMVLPALILMMAHFLFKGWLQRPLEKIRISIEKNSGSTLSWMMSIAGLILLINA
ncbi:GAP family protein [Mammaliicoccus lentus]|uniref:GAP family protein n=1 Tax=Mammaliicoccus lentus TaxID=42858 RepID=A0AAX3W3V9_MAMLE|nr:GAP family protein [Mammaliicoccus lentus]WHI59938.1 GAP family protein [Mammaliicoccus lentus]